MHGTILSHQTITFFPAETAAKVIAEANGGEAEGFVVTAAKGRPGKFVIQVIDTDDGTPMGHL